MVNFRSISSSLVVTRHKYYRVILDRRAGNSLVILVLISAVSLLKVFSISGVLVYYFCIKIIDNFGDTCGEFIRDFLFEI